MKRHTSRNTHRDEKPKPSRNEDSDVVLRARTEEERRRRRREWVIEQEKMDRHDRLKRKMAMEYEIRRARNMGLPLPEGRCSRPRGSRSGSPPSRHRRTSEHYTPKVTVLSKKFETSSDATPLFKGPEGTEISPTELRKIKVDIRRKIPGRAATHELKRDVPNKEDVVLKRRAGEGSKPIFDRDEIKRAISETEDVEEHRTVVTLNLENSENKSKTLKRRSTSLSLTRTRSHSPRRTSASSRHPRYDDSQRENKGSYRSDREKDHSRERKDGERSYRGHRERPKDHSRDRKITERSRESPWERRQRDRPREQRVPLQRYIEHIPIYYGKFQRRPLMVGPWVPIQGPLEGNVHPPMLRPLRIFPPRGIGIPPWLDYDRAYRQRVLNNKWGITNPEQQVLMMNEECPNCKQTTNTSCSRLVKDSCGHTKCRMCLLYEERGCKICSNERHAQSILNYDCQFSAARSPNDISSSETSSKCNEEIVLPLELVINKHTKSDDNNFGRISIDRLGSSEFYYDDKFSKRKEAYEFPTTDIKDNDILNNSRISDAESNGALLNAREHLNPNVSLESSSYEKTTTGIRGSQIETEFSSKGKLETNRSAKCSDRSHISVIPGTPQKYKCNICEKIFRNKKGKCYHDACVTGVRPYLCRFCDRTFIKRSHFEYHERIHRGYKPFKCNFCEKAFPQKNKLNRHMYSHSKEKQFVCSICNKGYTKRDDLKNHLGVHNCTTTYSCKVCEKTFRILTNLNRHLKTHTNERPHTCDQCNKSFKDKSLLIRHKKTHGKDRPFSCAHCNRVFLSKSELRRHLTVHSDEKPFSCKYCETVFRRKDNLHRHVRHHHPENPSLNDNAVQNAVSDTSTNSTSPKQTNPKQKQKLRKMRKVICNSLPKSSAKVSVVCVSSRDQISSRLDSMGNITPVIRTTSEVSNAVPVINGPISIKKPEDKTDSKKKTFTYTEPIPLAEAVVINKRIEEKLYPQNASNHNYFFRNCINCIDKLYPASISQSFRTNSSMKGSAHKATLYENSCSESTSSTQTHFTCRNVEEQVRNKNDIKPKSENESEQRLANSKEKCAIQTVNISDNVGLKQARPFLTTTNHEQSRYRD